MFSNVITVDVGLLISSAGVIVACLLWIYRELNSLREAISEFRIEVAQEYVSSRALKDVELRLENSLEKLGAKFDKAVDTFTKMILNSNSRIDVAETKLEDIANVRRN